jgi:hypothetical protein
MHAVVDCRPQEHARALAQRLSADTEIKKLSSILTAYAVLSPLFDL